MPRSYQDPVAKLLVYGACDNRGGIEAWPDYLALGFTEAHVPELLRMASDRDLNEANRDSFHIWAPVHAWRTLGQLRAEAAAGPLVRLFEQFSDDDWVNNELPQVLSLIGPAAVPALAGFLEDGDAGFADIRFRQHHDAPRIAPHQAVERCGIRKKSEAQVQFPGKLFERRVLAE